MNEKIGAKKAVEQLSGWTIKSDRDAVTKTYNFKDFNFAFGFMTQVAMRAEQMDHHPEWFNVYNRVEVLLSTHDADGVTAKDTELAQFMDSISGEQT